ncbi:MAG: sulfurtransferase TusA family protein [Actinobacteria bacterium]|nr:sulfurtransferase TusA family protein [Actinomycetota bacterium]
MRVIDALGTRCPQPIIETARAMRDTKISESIILLADDPATEPDLKAWARMTGNYVEVIGLAKFKVTKVVSKD